jgi:hypothetical protein
MAAIKLRPGETVVIAAIDPSLEIGGGPMPGGPGTPVEPGAPVDPGYGIDVGLGWLRPSHPIVLPPPTVPIEPPPEGPVDPAWGIDEDIGYVRPSHPIVLPPPAKPTLQWELKTAWTPVTGWIVVAVPTGNVPTPSAAAPRR